MQKIICDHCGRMIDEKEEYYKIKIYEYCKPGPTGRMELPSGSAEVCGFCFKQQTPLNINPGAKEYQEEKALEALKYEKYLIAKAKAEQEIAAIKEAQAQAIQDAQTAAAIIEGSAPAEIPADETDGINIEIVEARPEVIE